jgi:hypothetical protein
LVVRPRDARALQVVHVAVSLHGGPEGTNFYGHDPVAGNDQHALLDLLPLVFFDYTNEDGCLVPLAYKRVHRI